MEEMNDEKKQSDLWSNLSTVTTFDEGNETTTRRVNENPEVVGAGQIIGRVTPSTSLLIESLIQQLCALFEGNPKRRSELYNAICEKLHEMKLIDSTYKKIELEIVRGQYQKALYHLVTVARASTGSECALQLPNLTAEWSRYKREFQELEFIARGGFGGVFKALHRLDGIEYAVKKIIVRTDKVSRIMKHLEEVKTIAKLTHPNIVPYKQAWIETNLPTSCSTVTEDRSFKFSRTKSSSNEKVGELRIHKTSTKITLSESNITQSHSDVVSFRSSANNTRNKSNPVSKDNCSKEGTDGSDSCDDSNSNNRKLCCYDEPVTRKYATLYIQMALCERTLRDWLDKRESPTPINIITSILLQILCGLEYIHSCGIVHHDIKPSNIFISTSALQVQLGDFGLACPLQRESHDSQFGTKMYAAPEQLRGRCNPKSDMYSLGIVLLELFIPMKTDMERSLTISAAKLGQVPPAITASHPKWGQVLMQLVQKDPNLRPSAEELLNDLKEDKDLTIVKLKEENAIKDATIVQLNDRISQLEEEVQRLRLSKTSI